MRRRRVFFTPWEAMKLSRAERRAEMARAAIPLLRMASADAGTVPPTASAASERAMTHTTAALPKSPTHCHTTVASTWRMASGTSAKSLLSIMVTRSESARGRDPASSDSQS